MFTQVVHAIWFRTILSGALGSPDHVTAESAKLNHIAVPGTLKDFEESLTGRRRTRGRVKAD